MNLYGVTITCNWIAISLWFLYALTQGTLGMKNEKITRLLLEMLELDSSDYVRLMVSNTATSVPLKSKCWSEHAFTGKMFLVRTIIVYYGVKWKSYFSWILWKVDFFNLQATGQLLKKFDSKGTCILFPGCENICDFKPYREASDSSTQGEGESRRSPGKVLGITFNKS